jgi:hypothetical protein
MSKEMISNFHQIFYLEDPLYILDHIVAMGMLDGYDPPYNPTSYIVISNYSLSVFKFHPLLLITSPQSLDPSFSSWKLKVSNMDKDILST